MTKLLANLKIGRKLGLLLGSGLAVLSQQSGASPALKGVNHVWTGRVVIHERSVGIQRSSSNTLTARRCEVFSSGEVVALNLDDLDWEEGLLRIRRKGARWTQLPLPADVGEAIAVYLRSDRPQCS